MAFWDTVRTYLDKGVEASKDALTKANTAANDFGNTSRLRIEIQQLKSKRGKSSAKLGGIALEAFLGGAESIAAGDEAVKAVLDSVRQIDAEIAEKNRLLDEAAAQRKAAKEAAAKEAGQPADSAQ